ncbi:PepSY domain-containing protein [Deferribacter autotrophicus]|uniref:PepSY domain-containing protein n=1 Tax=Deferribacter autotrophicus TaxID=500465 RepID=A0A5A8F559_9BACT|nr:PepSY domain-containing protein [Deferribacter autotrophicus]KAA0258820.1 PepSY domain-containing protein [Deferribacter autotrophicus]
MKKLLILATVVIFGATLAFAHGPGFGRGYGYGMGPGMMGPGYNQGTLPGAGYGMGPGMMGPGYNQGFGYGPGYCMGYGAGFQGNVKQITEDDAKKLVEKILKENFKGYKVKEVEKFRMPMGTMYEVDVVDAAGNKFEFHVNPWGFVMGPFPDNYDTDND